MDELEGARAVRFGARRVGYVLESGSIIMQGTSAELANNKHVQAAYLGI